MTTQRSETPMTAAQRDEIKRLCVAAEIPDKSGELYNEESAQALIDDLRQKASAAKSSDAAGHRHDW